MNDGNSMLISLLPFLIMSIPVAICAAALAPSLGKSRALWAILCLIPLINLFFLYYVFYCVSARVLDRLDEIAKRVGVEV
ncbi:hypothetical protein [Bradyrhizobium sp. sBnM-33]|uniref:hypothetical protein n=1 Tax=Bradyrhizobium sp. sBnM-33 TaxID=2831780 RepID=UPI001BCEF634|nr:hypothetical protein [Bradyrhizobium sp. sBnM-33]WOH49294.1 hypothetical protein RX328_35305 [Bradyrhizobium sp. sBnM-33]